MVNQNGKCYRKQWYHLCREKLRKVLSIKADVLCLPWKVIYMQHTELYCAYLGVSSERTNVDFACWNGPHWINLKHAITSLNLTDFGAKANNQTITQFSHTADRCLQQIGHIWKKKHLAFHQGLLTLTIEFPSQKNKNCIWFEWASSTKEWSECEWDPH